MLRWVLGAVGAAVVMFLWGFVYWGLLPFGAASIHSLPNEDAVRAALRAGNLPTGVYYLPKMGTDPAAEAHSLEGPIVKLYYRAEGGPPMSPARMGLGWLHGLVAALLAGYLLATVTGVMNTFPRRLAFVFALGLFGSFTMVLGDAIWWHHPLGFQLTQFGYHAVNWLLAGLVLAAVIKEPVRLGR
jgi:hypothetical protein